MADCGERVGATHVIFAAKVLKRGKGHAVLGGLFILAAFRRAIKLTAEKSIILGAATFTESTALLGSPIDIASWFIFDKRQITSLYL